MPRTNLFAGSSPYREDHWVGATLPAVPRPAGGSGGSDANTIRKSQWDAAGVSQSDHLQAAHAWPHYHGRFPKILNGCTYCSWSQGWLASIYDFHGSLWEKLSWARRWQPRLPSPTRCLARWREWCSVWRAWVCRAATRWLWGECKKNTQNFCIFISFTHAC